MTTFPMRVLALLVLAAASLHGQDLGCRGVGLSAPAPDGVMISLDLARTNGNWTALHGRIDRAGSKRPTSVSLRGDSIVVAFDELKATYTGTIAAGTGIIRGAWNKDGKSMALVVRCKAIAPTADQSPHKTEFVSVEKGVQLEVLDWGGNIAGRPLVFVHGENGTAHDFDDFAPKLTTDHRVVAITRRGAGRSSFPDTGYFSSRLGDDVVAVLDSLHLNSPVLVGHSLGGVALSSVGSRYPNRIAGLIYLDAAYPYAYTDSVRDTLVVDPRDRPHCPCSVVEQMELDETHFHRIPVPVLAVYAMKPDWDTRSYDDRAPDWTPAQQAREFERGVPTARVVRIPNASHLVFRSNEAEVLAAMRSFIAGLPAVKP